MKNVLIIVIVLIIAAGCVWLVCNARSHAVEHYACTSAPGSAAQAAAAGIVIDIANRTATLSGGPRSGTYRGLDITPTEVTWQKDGDFTFDRHNERLVVLWAAGNVTYQSTAQCEPQTITDRVMTMVD